MTEHRPFKAGDVVVLRRTERGRPDSRWKTSIIHPEIPGDAGVVTRVEGNGNGTQRIWVQFALPRIHYDGAWGCCWFDHAEGGDED